MTNNRRCVIAKRIIRMEKEEAERKEVKKETKELKLLDGKNKINYGRGL